MITIPNGQIGMEFFAPVEDPTTGNRNQWFSYHLQDNNGTAKGPLVGVTSGSLEWHANASIKGGGKIVVQQEDRGDTDWLKRRIKIVMHIQDLGEFPLGVFIPSAPTEAWDDMNLSLDIELLDKCSVLAEDYVASTYALEAGTVVTTAVRALIVSSGETAGSITDSTHALSKDMVWEAGTSKLQIINDLLSAADFFSLYVDGNGAFRVEQYRAPKGRPVMHEFIDNFESVYSPVFNYERDIYSIPNKVIAIGKGDGDDEAEIATATNENPNSPYSYQSRGRWIVDVQKGVEATDEDALQSYANRRLAALSSPQGTLTITHAPLPWLTVNDAVRFKRSTADLDMKAVVTSMTIDLDPTALSRTNLLEVVDL